MRQYTSRQRRSIRTADSLDRQMWGLPTRKDGAYYPETRKARNLNTVTATLCLVLAAGAELRNFVVVKNFVGTFSVEDAFCLTGFGWVLAGEVKGAVMPRPGNQLAFDNGALLPIKGVDFIRKASSEIIGLAISSQFESRQELVNQNIIGATAQILE